VSSPYNTHGKLQTSKRKEANKIAERRKNDIE
jgi:hypothetical protein